MAEFDDTLDLLPAAPPSGEDGLADAALVVDATEATPPPIGRSWLFDLGTERFVLHGGRPQETRGTATLLQWVDKFLHSAKGALPIHPAWFGMTDPYAIFGRPVRELSAVSLLRDMQDMTNHPNIAAVTDVQVITDPNDDAAWLEVSILTDPPSEDVELLVHRVPVGG